MKEHQQAIREFMRLAGQRVPESPCEPTNEEKARCARLILEEAFETIEKGLGLNVSCGDYDIHANDLHVYLDRPFDMIETIDGCGDLHVVTTCLSSACGADCVPIQQEVDANNLKKFGPGGYRRDDGKWVKPPNHQPPDIEGLLEQQGWEKPAKSPAEG